MKKLLLLLGLFVLFIYTCRAEVMQFQFDATNGTDTYIHGTTTTTNDGSGIWLHLGKEGGGGTPTKRVLMNWNNSCYSLQGTTINNVTLSLNRGDSEGSPTVTGIYPMTSPWEELVVTWANCGSGGCTGAYNSSWNILVGSTLSYVSWNYFTLNSTWLQSECQKPSSQRYGFIMFSNEASANGWLFSSSDYSTAGLRPILSVNYTLSSGDTTPPAIQSIHCASCTGDPSPTIQPFETEDTTPTLQVNTSENANCRIGVLDVNYTIMTSNRNCQTTGTTSHVCSLTPQDRFSNPGLNYLYVSCADAVGNEGNATDHSKSNSGRIMMGILGASETPGDDSIQLGIIRSEIGATAAIYSSQRISARDLSNNQFSGVFDKFAVNGNKRWAFNYVSIGETPISGLFNLTPVLYVLQLQNATNETIIDQVGKLINTTWP